MTDFWEQCYNLNGDFELYGFDNIESLVKSIEDGETILNEDLYLKVHFGFSMSGTHKSLFKEDSIIFSKLREFGQNRIKEWERAWREKNRDRLNARGRENYQMNKEKILAKAREKITCECGCVISRGNKSVHKKTKKHKELMNNL